MRTPALRHVSELFMASELASELYCDELLAGDGSSLYVDSVCSVSALAEAEAADRFYGV